MKLIEEEFEAFAIEVGFKNGAEAFEFIGYTEDDYEDCVNGRHIVVYEVDDKLVVHRIVGIEKPNTKHPDEYYFLCQGDAVETPDRFPVRYSQIKGIYRGERIEHIGSLVSFMQSPAG